MARPNQNAAPSQRKQKAPASARDLAVIEAAMTSTVREQFQKLRVATLEWDPELRYALDIIAKPDNDFLRECAKDNPQSVAGALLDLSRVGLSLNPVLGHAYLIPGRDGGRAVVRAAPSYRGFENLVLRSEKALAITTELVYKNDKFRRFTDRSGPNIEHEPARGNRGELEGGYCIAQLANGKVHIEFMSADEIDACEKAATRKNNGKVTPAWTYFRPEMQKKCVVRRAAKHWPIDQHAATAMALMDLADPMDFGDTKTVDEPSAEATLCLSEDDVADIIAKLELVPEESRGAWVVMASKAMGFNGGPTYVPVDQRAALEERLLARMKLVHEKGAAR